MEGTHNASTTTRIVSFLFFVFLTIASLWWFTASAYGTLHSLLYGKEVVHFSKGAMYSLGAGLGLLLLTVLGVYQNLRRIDLSKAQTKWATRLSISSIIVMFVFPMIAHFAVSSLAAKNGYSECKEVNYQWLLYKNIVYVNSQGVCTELANNRGHKGWKQALKSVRIGDEIKKAEPQ